MTKTLRVQRMKTGLSFEIYNVFNSSVVLNQNQNFGPALGRPATTLQGRLFKLSGLLRF